MTRTVRRSKRRVGGSLASMLSKAHAYIKSKRLASSAARHFLPKSNLHKILHVAGYGRRKRRPAKRPRRYGSGFFGDVWSGIKKAAGWVKDNHVLSSVAGLIPHPAGRAAAIGLKMAGLGRSRHYGRGFSNMPVYSLDQHAMIR